MRLLSCAWQINEQNGYRAETMKAMSSSFSSVASRMMRALGRLATPE